MSRCQSSRVTLCSCASRRFGLILSVAVFCHASDDDFTRWARSGEARFAEQAARLEMGGDPHETSIYVMGLELYSRALSDEAKTDAATKGVRLASAIMLTRDPSVPIGREHFPDQLPDFDAAKYGLKPFFGRVDPNTITDPVARAAYSDALTRCLQQLELWGKNTYRQEEADYSIDRVRDIVAGARQKDVVGRAVANAIDALSGPDWIKDYLRMRLRPVLGGPVDQSQPRLSPVPDIKSTANLNTRIAGVRAGNSELKNAVQSPVGSADAQTARAPFATFAGGVLLRVVLVVIACLAILQWWRIKRNKSD